MKKLMVVFTALTIALCAKATNIKWGLGAGNTLSEIDAGTFYLVGGLNPSSLSAETFSESVITTAGGKVYDSFSYSGSAATSTVLITPANSGLSGNQDFYAICISDDGKKLAYGTKLTASITASTSPTMTKTNVGGAFTYTDAVPEPTSALLLMLGVAGLALKRKRA